MGVPRDNDGGGSGEKQYESFAGEDVNVNITDVGSFYNAMQAIQNDAQGPANMEVTRLTEFIRSGFMNPAGDAGVFPEGVQIGITMAQRQSEFKHFVADVLAGIRNIGAASVVIAELYHNTDLSSAAGVDDIAFAFSDPNAKGPKGFRKVESFSELEQRAREKAGQNAMALGGDESLATPHSPYGGVTVYTFPDGSSKQVTVTPYGNNDRSTTTTIFGPNGKVLESTTETVRGKDRSTSTTSYDGEKGSGTRSATSTQTGKDGTVTVTSENSTVDKDGKVTHSQPKQTTTVHTGQHDSGDQERGPVETAEKKYGTQGTGEFIKNNGVGY
jgi:hypothetical protein